MMPDLRLVQRFIANSFGVGIIRGMAPPGTLNSICSFLQNEIDLAEVSSRMPSHYPDELDQLTEHFIRTMPDGAKHWGMARKCLNLFFRDALYNVYLRDAYGLGKFESVLEIPLDSYVGRALRREDKRLPRWQTVIGLTPSENAEFQTVAAQVAARKGTYRVHLDLGYWREEENRTSAPAH